MFLALLLACTGCGQAPIGEKEAFHSNLVLGTSEEAAKPQRIAALKLPCSNKSLSAAPWQALDEETQRAMTLLFDRLVRLTGSYQAENAVAQDIQLNGTTCLITIRENLYFTDASPVTAQAVDTSLSGALAEGSYYRESLANIQSHRVSQNNQLEIILKEPDPNFANLLTFPIAQLSGGKYIGSGRYQYREQDENQIVLERNPNYWGEASSIPEIDLVELPRQEIASYSLKMGNVDCIYAGMDNDAALSLSSSNYPVPCNRLVFLGVNGQKGLMTNQKLRQAVSLAIDRTYLASAVYASMAKASYTPFHPDFYRIQGMAEGKRELQQAKALLAESGKLDENERLKLKLVYHSENVAHAQLAKQLSADLYEAGIETELVGKAFADYLTALEHGNYDLYVGELDIPNNMDLSHLLSRGEKYGYGTVTYAPLAESFAKLKTDTSKAAYQAVLQSYQEFLPAIPLLYRQGMFSFSRKLALKVEAIPSDLFDHMEQWQ